MPRFAIATLAIVAAALAGCGGTPEPPPAAQLVEDVRVAMEAAPSFRFESTWTSTDPREGTNTIEIAGEVSGEDYYAKSDISGQSAPSYSAESLVVQGQMYERALEFPDDWPDPTAGQWRPSSMSYAELLERGGSLRKPFLPPEDLGNPVVTNNSEDDSWLLSGSYPLPDEPGEGNSYSITPVALWTATVDPKTSRLLTTETMIDYGIASYEYGPSGPASGPQSNHLVWRIFDYDADITLTLPPDVTPVPTATPEPTA